MTALDIGQGDATLLQAGGHAILVDAGPAGAGIAGKLKVAGVRRLDALVVTHPQADHDGGAPAVLAALPVAMLLDGRGGDRSPTSTAIDAPARRERTRDHRGAGRSGRPRGPAHAAHPLAARRPGDARHRPQRPRGRRRRRGVRGDRAADRRRRVAGPRAARSAAGRRPQGQPPRQRRPRAPGAAAASAPARRAHRGRRPQHLRPSDACHAPGPRDRGAGRQAHRPRRRRPRRPPRRASDGDERMTGLVALGARADRGATEPTPTLAAMATWKPAYLIHGDDHGRIAERRAGLRARAEAESGAGGLEVIEGDASTPEDGRARAQRDDLRDGAAVRRRRRCRALEAGRRRHPRHPGAGKSRAGHDRRVLRPRGRPREGAAGAGQGRDQGRRGRHRAGDRQAARAAEVGAGRGQAPGDRPGARPPRRRSSRKSASASSGCCASWRSSRSSTARASA